MGKPAVLISLSESGPGVAGRTDGMLHTIFEQAARLNLIVTNPAKGVRKVSTDDKIERHLFFKDAGLNRRPPRGRQAAARGNEKFHDYDLGFVHIDVTHLPKLRTADGEIRLTQAPFAHHLGALPCCGGLDLGFRAAATQAFSTQSARSCRLIPTVIKNDRWYESD